MQFIWMWLRSVFLLPSLTDVPPYQPVANMAQDHTTAGGTQDFLVCPANKQEKKKKLSASVCLCACVRR